MQLRAHPLGLRLIGELGDGLDGLDANLALGTRKQRQQRVDQLAVSDSAEGAHHDGKRFAVAGPQHLGETRHCALAADLRERVHRTLAHPPVLVARRLDQVIDRLVFGAFYQSGQSCISVQRIYVHESLYDDLKKRLVAAVKKLKAGDPKKKDTFLGPMIDEAAAERLQGWIEEARKAA